MDVRLLKRHTHNKYDLAPGTIITVPRAIGQQWIQGGVAEPLRTKKAGAKPEKPKDNGTVKPE